MSRESERDTESERRESERQRDCVSVCVREMARRGDGVWDGRTERQVGWARGEERESEKREIEKAT